ncbi:MAG: hypothetical protein LBJ73_02415 [Rickettsiales bacterium]|nr:hypothetical protein [Rickettsiales bacterium]
MKTSIAYKCGIAAAAAVMFLHIVPAFAVRKCNVGETCTCTLTDTVLVSQSYFSCSTGGRCTGLNDASCGKDISTDHQAYTDPFSDDTGSGVYEIEACTTTEWQTGTCTLVPAVTQSCCVTTSCEPCTRFVTCL